MSRFGGSRIITEATSTGIREVVIFDYDAQLLAEKAKMLQLAEEQLTGVKRITVTSPKTGKSEGYIIAQQKPYNLFSVALANGGPTPKDLSGTFTSFAVAETAIATYVRDRKESYYDEVIAKELNAQ